MSYHGTGINNSATIVAQAAADITGGAFLAATLTENGADVAKTGEVPVGLFISETDNLKTGEDVTIQVKDIGLAKIGSAVKAGDLLSADANGKLVKVTAGAFAFATALETASAADQIIPVQIIKAGYTPAAGV